MKPYIQLTQGRIEPNKFADQPPLSPPYNNLANYIEIASNLPIKISYVL